MTLHLHPAKETEGFGAPPQTHGFTVHIPPEADEPIRIVECFELARVANAERCRLPRLAWGAIQNDLERHFNARLEEKNIPAGMWTEGANRIERLLGQELMVLAWAVETADPALIPAAIDHWLALKPHERWWLYSVTAACTGAATQCDVGWRKALKIALTETPPRVALTLSSFIS